MYNYKKKKMNIKKIIKKNIKKQTQTQVSHIKQQELVNYHMHYIAYLSTVDTPHKM